MFVSAKTLLSWQNEGASPVILDCRSRLGEPNTGRQLYLDSHIKGAQFADLETDLANLALGSGRHPLPKVEDFIGAVRGWGVRDTPVVVYDDMSGAIAARAWWMLRWIGLSEVFILDGGLQAWQQFDGLLCQEVSTPSPSRLTPIPNSMPVVSGQQIRQWVDGASGNTRRHLLLDARAGERFRGEVEPIDRRAGHVPGATSRPFADSLNDGHLLDYDTLLRSWQDILGEVPSEQVTHMCGSGVTACFNLACMEHLNKSGSSLYVDSWSGWISDYHS